MDAPFPWVTHRTQREVAETEWLRSLRRRLSWGEERRLERLTRKELAANSAPETGLTSI